LDIYPVSVGRPRTRRKRPTAARIMKAAVVGTKGDRHPVRNFQRTWKTPVAMS
jgi:hypothetical protein